jgi:hypothetical protein
MKAWCDASGTVGTVIVTFTDRSYAVYVASETVLQKSLKGKM